jgi:hypothetical protein
MSNLLLMPQLPGGLTYDITFDSDWLDQRYVQQPNWPAAPAVLAAALTQGSPTIVVSSTAALVPGMPVQGLGIAPGSIIAPAGIVDGTHVTLSLPATLTLAAPQLSFFGPPLDLTGITFRSKVRSPTPDSSVILDCSTQNGLFLNSAPLGYYGWYVRKSVIRKAPWPAALKSTGNVQCETDIIACDGLNTVNLCTVNGPITLNVTMDLSR